MDAQARSIVIGAGIGGLAVALRLRAQGRDVLVLERAPEVGGKMRTVPSEAGPVDTGPTVLTMKPVFDDLFASIGESLEDHVTLAPEPHLARHWWRDGAVLDLWQDQTRSAAEISGVFGPAARTDFEKFSAEAARLFDAFDLPMMRASKPSRVGLTARVLKEPSLIRAMAPLSTLAQKLARDFRDPHLRQLFGRYATYVGGSPYRSPAVLSLISHSEASGVWRVAGGMHNMALSLKALAEKMGVSFMLGADVTRIEMQGGTVAAVHTGDGRFACDEVVFNGDPRALSTGLLGATATAAVPAAPLEKRSLSARVWAFAARAAGPDLVHHNVFFATDPRGEFDPIAKGEMPEDATIYICAEDRGTGITPPDLERFEIILNAAPTTDAQKGAAPTAKEKEACRQRTHHTLAQFGLAFDSWPADRALTIPREWEARFPGSAGSLYGQSPHGMMAAFQRPTARTRIPGLFLVGGGTHPGAGVPMATLSAQHAAEEMRQARTSTSPSRPTATRGGMSTA
ncbi:MAG: phytoene desaturase family protein [Rhodobacteraceae bacterium]|nr:phytoene desaturase family protein [Paracoccaceae bacterium]